ncbi:hypothetical protein [Fundicoccus culcitae]|uniref:Uncharacterized protein n=1 Tax=Fundicoccus culcitae TaxID=2969821 RepID=A0ABY5PA88_9LACT|nr:hypothetical protein [Fundicoccus culcitae]UUX35340.1 hypothetical protein NRE15_06760 [Fundicoccus culcitae]
MGRGLAVKLGGTRHFIIFLLLNYNLPAFLSQRRPANPLGGRPVKTTS